MLIEIGAIQGLTEGQHGPHPALIFGDPPDLARLEIRTCFRWVFHLFKTSYHCCVFQVSQGNRIDFGGIWRYPNTSKWYIEIWIPFDVVSSYRPQWQLGCVWPDHFTSYVRAHLCKIRIVSRSACFWLELFTLLNPLQPFFEKRLGHQFLKLITNKFIK